MNCDTFARQLRVQIGKSWDDDELMLSRAMEEHALDCPHCMARLSAARALRGPDTGTLAPAADLGPRVLGQLRQDGARLSRGPRWPVLAAAAALLVLLTAGITVAVMRSQGSDGVEVHLVLTAPGATSVAVVGDWNNWDVASQSLSDTDGDGVWELRFHVVPGKEYEYQFVIDETRWISDPDALLQVDDGFGGKNSVLDI